MILRELILEDFGLYAGRVEIDLAPRSGIRRGATPIVLLGGRNGAGKTTVLEAVRLALHGKRALGASVGKSAFHDYLRGRMHRSRNDIATSAAVSITFDYGEDGENHRYTVRRSWSAHGAKVVDGVELLRDGKELASVPRDEWESFLQDLIPPGISQLFFFDGEKIQEIADGDDPDGQIAEAIRGLLGIELVGRLRSDLSLYLARHRREQDDSLADELEAAGRDLMVAEQEVAELAEAAADALTTRESRARHAEQIHNRFVAEGGAVALERAKFEQLRDQLNRQAEQQKADLRKFANGYGPFLLGTRVLKRLKLRLEGSTDVDRKAAAKLIGRAIEEWRSKKHPEGWSADQRADLGAMLEGWSKSSPDDGSGISQALGGRDRGLATIALIEGCKERATETARAMEANSEAKAQVEAALGRVNSDVTDEMLAALKRAEREAGAAEEVWRQRDMQLAEARSRHAGRSREQKRLIALQEDAAAVQNRADLAVRVAGVLRTYEERLLTQKVVQLSHDFVRCFQELARKPGLIGSVDIDPETFRLTLRDDVGNEVARASLSAGEKQVFAIALLWALGRTSGRSLPVIVDTPLARLDTIHRRHLVERYFPAASEQVIILSTDAEIDASLRAALEPHLSHAMQLEFDSSAKRTNVSEGYFGDDRVVSHAV